jgi:large conductance mechanosensitive channel
MLTEFREFLEKFNVIPAAVGLVLALATIPVMEAVVNVIMSLIGKAGGLDVNFDEWNPSDIPLGTLITALITFVMIAFVVFMIVKSLARAGANTAPAATPDQTLLTEIRDLLAK